MSETRTTGTALTPEDVVKLIRPDIMAMEPYTPVVPFEVLGEQLGRPPDEIIKLNANENPYGPSPRALEALAALNGAASIYPDPEARRLRALLADYVGVDAACIMVGAGSDELILLLASLFLAPGDAIIDCPPTFSMYPFNAAIAGARVVNVPRHPDFSLDVEGIERAARESGARLIFLCSPNNPDGGVIAPADLDRLLALPLIVVVDEAYHEFSSAESVAPRVPDTPNLIVLRTFSKWAGLAGLRVGYGIIPPPIIEHLWKIKQPYNVNVAADVAARATLKDLPRMQANVRKIVAERERLLRELSAISFLEPYPSQANFVLCRVTGIEAATLRQWLEDEGILIRYYNKPGLRDHVRITAGTPAQTDALLAALRRIEAKTG